MGLRCCGALVEREGRGWREWTYLLFADQHAHVASARYDAGDVAQFHALARGFA